MMQPKEQPLSPAEWQSVAEHVAEMSRHLADATSSEHVAPTDQGGGAERKDEPGRLSSAAD
jgi:hypothetical protein